MVLDLPDRLLRILHIDDDEDGFVLMRDLLSSIRELNVEIEWISTFNDALERLSQNEHDLCLLDYLLGERDGISVLKDARAQGCRVPIIMLTGSGNRYVDLEAMQSGASYYIDKYNLDKFDIERAIRYSLEHARLLRGGRPQ